LQNKISIFGLPTKHPKFGVVVAALAHLILLPPATDVCRHPVFYLAVNTLRVFYSVLEGRSKFGEILLARREQLARVLWCRLRSEEGVYVRHADC